MTLQGAKNRALRAREAWRAQKCAEKVGVAALGIESGLVPVLGDTFFDVAFAALITPDNHWGYGIGRGLHVPTSMAQEALSPGNELGAVVQRLTGGGEKDPHRYLTEGKSSARAPWKKRFWAPPLSRRLGRGTAITDSTPTYHPRRL